MSIDYSVVRSRNFQHSQQNLRERAEKRRLQVSSLVVLDDGTPPQQVMQELMQELQIHQIELEIQYEELLMLQAETESLRARYTDLFEYAPVGYVTLDVLGMVRELNQLGAKLLGTAQHRLTNRRFLQFVAPASRERFLRMMIDVLATEDPITLYIKLLRDDDTEVYVRLDGVSLPDPLGNRLCCLALTDLTVSPPRPTESSGRRTRAGGRR